MIYFKDVYSGTVTGFTDEIDIISMRRHPEYVEVEAPVKPTKGKKDAAEQGKEQETN